MGVFDAQLRLHVLADLLHSLCHTCKRLKHAIEVNNNKHDQLQYRPSVMAINTVSVFAVRSAETILNACLQIACADMTLEKQHGIPEALQITLCM